MEQANGSNRSEVRSMTLQSMKQWTAAEYLAFERQHPEKHMFVEGTVILQAGGSRAHAIISANVLSNIHQQLLSRSCTAYGSDMRIAIPKAKRYVYADVTVACEFSQFEDGEEDNLTNPTLIVEVLSPSTERDDRGKKFLAYQTIPSFQEYLLIAQDSIFIEHFVRHTNTLWMFEAITDPTAEINLASIGCRLSVARIYEKLQFDPQAPDTEHS
jgi:Uma2 family endonuclease